MKLTVTLVHPSRTIFYITYHCSGNETYQLDRVPLSNIVVRFQHFSSRLSGLLASAKLIARCLENSSTRPQTVQDISFHFAKRFVARVPENGVSKNVETFRPELEKKCSVYSTATEIIFYI